MLARRPLTCFVMRLVPFLNLPFMCFLPIPFTPQPLELQKAA
jgi:hypothetical protein